MKIEKNQKYIVRAKNAGVFYGNIKEKLDTPAGVEVTMTNARCLWYWDGAATLIQLAAEGVKKPQNCKFTMPIEELTICEVCEILACSPTAISSVDGVTAWKR